MKKRNKSHTDFHQSKTAFYLMFIVALLGALSWLPYLYDLFKPIDLNLKVLEFYQYIQLSDSVDRLNISNPNYDSRNYLIKLAVVAKNKNFDLKEIQCQGYDSLNNISKIEVKSWTTLFYYDSQGTGNIEYTMRLNEDDYLNNKVSIKKEETTFGYIGLSTDLPMKKIKKIVITFVTSNEKRILKEIKSEDIFKAKKKDPIFL